MGNSKSNVLGFTSHTEFKRPENDFYSTDPREVEKLLEKERFEGTIWEPACGNGATGSGPYNTSQGTIFSSTVSLSTYGGSSSAITLNNLVDLVINTAHVNRDGTMSFTGSNIYLYNSSGIGVLS